MKLFSKLIFVFFLCQTYLIHSQNELSKSIDSIDTIFEAKDRIPAYQKLLQKTATSKKTEVTAMLFHKIALAFYKNKDYENALLYLNRSIEIKKQFSDIISLNKSLFLNAYIFQIQGKTPKAYQICEQIIKQQGHDKYTCNAYLTLASIEGDKGDFYKALEYLNAGLSNKGLSNNPKFKSQLSETVLLIYGLMYEGLSDEEEANKSDLEIVKLHQSIIEENIKIVAKNQYNLAAVYNNLAIVYDCFEELDESLKFYKKAQKIYKAQRDLSYELYVVLNIGMLYSRQQKHQLANQYYQRVIDESSEVDQIANALANMGHYSPTKNSTEKLPYFQKAINTCLERQTIKGEDFILPSVSQIRASTYEQDVFVYLIDLANHYVKAYKQIHEKEYLLKAKETVIVIDQLASLIRYETDTDASKLFWIEKGVHTYMLAVEICYHLHDAEKAFYFMEKNKALLLQENIKTLQSKLTLDIPNELLEREYKLHYEVLNLQEQFQQHLDNDSLKQQFASKKKAFQAFMDSMQIVYPKYIKTKEKVAIVSLQNIMETYKTKETAFVEYILHKTDGYGIYFDGETPVFFKIENVADFQKQLQSLRKFMTKRVMNTKERKTFQVIGYQIFKKLFPFENAIQRLQNKKITIIPDHTLQYIPFEVLSIQTTGKLSEAYFVNITETSYLQSFSLFKQIQQKQNTPTQKLLAIAPIEFKNSELPTLKSSAEAFKSFKKDITSLVLQKEQATKANFLKHRNNFEIIHLNTHAGLDSIAQTPWLAFHDSNISLTELFGLGNQAELVVLDACKTNDGVNLSGEGIINLSRGFFYNGTQSVLASQWNVNEKAGNEILQSFYSELENGSSKSEALQLAKKNYLRQHETKQNIPYYWAAFTLTGSTKAVVQTSWFNTVALTIGVLILLLVVFLYYKKKFFK